MTQKKTRIVLDSDVVIHFIKGDSFSLLLKIFPEYQYTIHDVVYNELSKNNQTRIVIDNVLNYISDRIQMVEFNPDSNLKREYARLLKNLGKGESACMIYCLDNKDVLGSSNLKDIKKYCEDNGITYLTTLDFIYYAYIRNLMSKDDCDEFILKVQEKGSKLPFVDISSYCCTVII